MIRIRTMTTDDIPAGLALSRQAGWNQSDVDWRRAVELEPGGGFVALCDGEAVGTTTTCVFGKVAWVALVLVDERFRRQGIARALMEHALEYLDGRGVASARLDATPLGQPLYERLGFAAQYRLARYEGVLPAGGATPRENVITVPQQRWPELAVLDEAVTRTDRGKLLLRLFAEEPAEVWAVAGEQGWSGLLASRQGARARQLGPCVGADGGLLLEDARGRHQGKRVFLDVPEGNRDAVGLADSWGLTIQRHLARMCRGVPVVERVEQLWASACPAKG
jgi:GNAT superfamily N-acetyltransferase